MKLLGDVSESDKKLAAELLEAEEYWDTKSSHVGYPPTIVAKAYVCLAHDWYQLGEDDHGAALLEKAERVYPGYFRNVMLEQTEEDSDFNLLVKNLVVELAWMLVNRLKGN